MPQLPDVAPLAEGAPGLTGYELLNWFGMFATAGTPPDRSSTGSTPSSTTRSSSRSIAEFLTVQGIVPRPMNAAEYKKFVAAETEKFGMIVKQANIKFAN